MDATIQRILPRAIDNHFGGHDAAVWLFAVIIVIRLMMSVSMIGNPRRVAAGPDRIPLDTFEEAAASRFLSLFTVLGVTQLGLALLGVLALVQYRGMIPLLYVLLLGEMLARRLIVLFKPMASEGPQPVGFYINLALLALLVAGLALSLRPATG